MSFELAWVMTCIQFVMDITLIYGLGVLVVDLHLRV